MAHFSDQARQGCRYTGERWEWGWHSQANHTNDNSGSAGAWSLLKSEWLHEVPTGQIPLPIDESGYHSMTDLLKWERYKGVLLKGEALPEA